MSETKEQLAYAAGIVDGEGCISLYKSNNQTIRKRPYQLRVFVVNTDKKIIDFMSEFGGSSNKRSGGIKQQYYWSISGKSAAEFLEKVVIYLTAKKEQAEIAIEFASTLQNSQWSMTEDIELTRESMALRLKELKK